MSTAQRRPGWWYPYIFVGGFAVVIAVNAALFYFASSSFTGLQTEGAYEKGLSYNKILAQAKAQEALGWSAAVELAPYQALPDGQRSTVLTVTLRDRSGKAVDGLAVQAALVRPTATGFDREVVLDGQGDGRYVAPVVLPLPGQWDVELAAAGPAGEFKMNKRVMLP